MQIVIDIPESVKQAFDKATKDDICGGYYDCNGIIGRAIQNGVPLPKGHGRLIDADEIQFENAEFDTYSDYSRAFDAIDGAETIIEADAESEGRNDNIE